MKKILTILFALMICALSMVTCFAADPADADTTPKAPDPDTLSIESMSDLDDLLNNGLLKYFDVYVTVDGGEKMDLRDAVHGGEDSKLAKLVNGFECGTTHKLVFTIADKATGKVISSSEETLDIQHELKDGACVRCKKTEAQIKEEAVTKPADPAPESTTQKSDETTTQKSDETTTQKSDETTTVKNDDPVTTTKKDDAETTTRKIDVATRPTTTKNSLVIATREGDTTGGKPVLPSTGSTSMAFAISAAVVSLGVILFIVKKKVI